MIRTAVILVAGFLIFSCAFGAMSGIKAPAPQAQPARSEVHVLSDLHILSENHLMSGNQNGDLPTLALIGGVALILYVVFSGRKGGGGG